MLKLIRSITKFVGQYFTESGRANEKMGKPKMISYILIVLFHFSSAKFLITGGLGYFARDFTIIKDDGRIDGRKLLRKSENL